MMTVANGDGSRRKHGVAVGVLWFGEVERPRSRPATGGLRGAENLRSCFQSSFLTSNLSYKFHLDSPNWRCDP